ncbi:aminomethyltransferase, mitochondrial-like [Anneissia japonica]|uniref:aminomethyltransferase, mitochondrial-like n=1 Tax=Anneissia japonica TaxID=1529436 RepID=UPI0014259F04|nr:aminomethyltransferase, mitochondrial-like [Anneissia japonica]
MALICSIQSKTATIQRSSILVLNYLRNNNSRSGSGVFQQHCSFLSSQEVFLKKTPLHDFHVAHGAKMVDFAGWSMPVQYKDGLIAEHHQCRNDAALFDVSHMLQSRVLGKDRIRFMESLIVGDIESLVEDSGTLSVLTNENGGIIDDLIVSKVSGDNLYVVLNAGCADKDRVHIEAKLEEFRSTGGDVNFETIPNRSLLALQGPSMAKVLQAGVTYDLSTLTFMKTAVMSVFGIPDCRVTRCGYTGEDGVEISVPDDKAVQLAETLLNSGEGDVKLAGLGARDSLRLEAGLCLYGNDIDKKTSPVEATLAWTIGKRRRQEANFPGAEIILKQLKEKPSRKRVGVISNGAPARAGTPILNEGGEQVGQLTSGCPSPTLKCNVAMGYIETKYAKNGTQVKLQVRKKQVEAKISKMPFVPAKYYTGK